MKKILTSAIIIALAVLVSPLLVSAAYNDVSLTTDTVITVGGINLNVSGSTAAIESIDVLGTYFTVVISNNSSIKVTSADRRVLTVNAPSKYIVTNTCDNSVATLKLASFSGTITAIITPQSTTCTNSSPSSSGSRSSGGSGGAIKKVGAVIAPVATQPAVTTAQPVVTTTATFTRDLMVGSTGADVIALQNAIGISPATGYFGSLTKAALKTYQTAHGISATGQVGPITRASLNGSVTTTNTTTTTTTNTTSGNKVKYTRNLKVGSVGDDVKQLQQFLNANGFTVATEGVGSLGNETNYMGKLTVEAIKKFQIKYEIASSGTPETTGFGALGPKTRAKLNELMNQ